MDTSLGDVVPKAKRFYHIKTEDPRKYPGPYLNPWVRLSLYIIMIFLTGCVYWGWSGIQEMLYKAGSFADLCQDAPDKTKIIIGSVEYIDCGARKSGINNLFTITYSAHFLTSVFGGFISDMVGPKLCYMMGQSLTFTSWILITSCPHTPWILAMSFFFIGLSTEPMYISLLSVSYYFPENRSLVISGMGATRSLSFLIPSIMSFFYTPAHVPPDKIYIVGLVYAIFANFLCFVLAFFIVQTRFFVADEKNDTKVPEHTEGNRVTKFFKDIHGSIRSGIRHPQFFEFALVVCSMSLFMTAVEFINKSQRELLVTSDGQSAVYIYKFIIPLTFIPGPFLGVLIDKFGAAIVLIILHSFCGLYYVFSFFDVYSMKVLACLTYLIAGSLSISSTYCYVNSRFPPERFGSLIGIIFTVVGLATLTNIPLYNYFAITLSYKAPFNFRPATIVMMCYMIVCVCMSSTLLCISKKNSKENVVSNEV